MHCIGAARSEYTSCASNAGFTLPETFYIDSDKGCDGHATACLYALDLSLP